MWLQRIEGEGGTPERPVSVSEAKANLRYARADQDDFIGSLIDAATVLLEGRNGILGRALVTQTWEMRLDCFPCRYGGRIEFPMPPLQSVDWIKYVDGAGDVQMLSPEEYVVDAQHMIGRVRPAYGKIWPVPLADDGAVRIQFKAGYGSPAAVPAPIKQAIKLLVGHWWLNREAVGTAGGPHAFAVEALTAPYRIIPV